MLGRRDGHKAVSWPHFTHLKLTCLGRGHYTPWYFASNLKFIIEGAFFHFLISVITMLGRRDGHKAVSLPHLKLTCLGRGHYTPWYFASNLKLSMVGAFFHFFKYQNRPCWDAVMVTRPSVGHILHIWSILALEGAIIHHGISLQTSH